MRPDISGCAPPSNKKRRPAQAAHLEGLSLNDSTSNIARYEGTAQQPAPVSRQRQGEALHRLGSRVVSELLNEIGLHRGIGDDIDRRLERHAVLDGRILAALGADQISHPREFDLLRIARRVCEVINRLADWSRPAADLAADREMGAAPHRTGLRLTGCRPAL
jgi:hypothetical protein